MIIHQMRILLLQFFYPSVLVDVIHFPLPKTLDQKSKSFCIFRDSVYRWCEIGDIWIAWGESESSFCDFVKTWYVIVLFWAIYRIRKLAVQTHVHPAELSAKKYLVAQGSPKQTFSISKPLLSYRVSY